MMRPEAAQLVDLLSRVVWRRLQERGQQDTLARKKNEERHAGRPVRPVFDRPPER